MTKPAAYSTTDVPVAKSQTDIRAMLKRHGVTQFSAGEGVDWAGVEFVQDGYVVRMRARLRPYSDEAVRAYVRQTHRARLSESQWEDFEARRVWRVLRWTLEARLVAVAEDLETFTQAFLPYIVNPATGDTVYESMVEVITSGALRTGPPTTKELDR